MIQRSPRIARKLFRKGVHATGMDPDKLGAGMRREIGRVGDHFYRLAWGNEVEKVELVEANDGDRVMEWVAK